MDSVHFQDDKDYGIEVRELQGAESQLVFWLHRRSLTVQRPWFLASCKSETQVGMRDIHSYGHILTYASDF